MAKVSVMVGGLFKFRNLLRELVVRDIKVRYRKSMLGLVWTLLYPLLTMAVMVMVFSNLFKITIENFSVYFLTGSILFAFHSESTSQALTSVLSNANLIQKVYIPKYLFPLSRVLSALVNLAFALVALLAVMLVSGAPFHPTLLLVFIPIGYLILFSTGIGLILAALNVFFRDTSHLYGVVTLLWTYMTPLFYPISIIPEKFKWMYEYNPMYYFIFYFRSLVIEGQIPGLATNMVCMLTGLTAMLVGLFIFYRTQDRFILHM